MRLIQRIACFLLALLLVLLPFIHQATHSIPSPEPSREEPLGLDWRVAVVSGDELFLGEFVRAVQAREVKILPPEKAVEALGCDLVVLGWDALPLVGSNGELVLKLLHSGRILAAARPGGDAIAQLLSSIVEPMKTGEKTVKPPPLAFFPVYEDNGYLKPGAPSANLVLLEAWELKEDKARSKLHYIKLHEERGSRQSHHRAPNQEA